MKDDKGHGSDPRGAHANGVNTVDKPILHPNVLSKVLANPNGISITLGGAQPTSNSMVSLPGHSYITSAADLRGPNGPNILKGYAAQHLSALSQPGAHIGSWTDTDTNKTHLDVSHNIANEGAAVAAGRARNQISIWDVKNAREIKTGGTGE